MAQDTLITMQEDLKRALARPPAERRWAMLIDLRKCVGCHGCTLGCTSEHKLPPDVVYRPVAEHETGTYPFVGRTFVPRPCMQCDAPACVPPCPKGATWKQEDGVVVIDYMRCIGCAKCVRACPYDARTIDGGLWWSEADLRQPWETAPAWEYGHRQVRSNNGNPIGKARKCHFCVTRLAQGLLPVCASSCLGRATYFGDESDPQALIAQVKEANAGRLQVLKPGAGTRPSVYYVANENLEVLNG